MHHVAIMNPSFLIDRILSGEKTIETRWYRTRRCPWGRIREGDIVWFKESGGPVRAKAIVSKVEEVELGRVDVADLVRKYAPKGKAFFRNPDKTIEMARRKKYAVFIHLDRPEKVEPFQIRKDGFGTGAAWLCVDDIEEIKIW